MIELRQLKHFLAVVEEGGIRRAARSIPLSPSSVARSVKMLETKYGVPLMVRRGKRVEPTAFGRHLAEEARALITGFEGIESRLGQMVNLSRGHLRIGISPAIADVFLPVIGSRFLREHSGVSMESRLGHATELTSWLVGREIDVAVADEGPFRIHGGLDISSLHSTEVPLWVRTGHPLLGKSELRVGDLVDYPFVSQFLPGAYQAWIEQVFAAAERERPGFRVNHAQKCTAYSVLIRLALDSDAVLHAPTLNILTRAWADGLVRLDIPGTVGSAQFAAVTLRLPSPPPLAIRFVELMQEATRTVLREFEPDD